LIKKETVMRKMGIVLLALVLTLALGGWAMAIHEGSEGTGEGPGIRADGPNLWKYISEENPYTKWALWPGKGKLYEGTEPHGMLLTTYVSKGAKQTIEGKKGTFAGGAIIVKENYKPDKTLAAITVMYKAKSYNPEAGDWFWAKYNPDGSIAKAGKVAGCINCHKQAADNDWVFTGPIK
jgi:hypothetical protein